MFKEIHTKLLTVFVSEWYNLLFLVFAYWYLKFFYNEFKLLETKKTHSVKIFRSNWIKKKVKDWMGREIRAKVGLKQE